MILLLFLSYSYASPEPPKATPPVVLTLQIKPTELFDLYTYPARVDSKVNTAIFSETSGVIKKILAPLGYKVSKNQRLMSIEHTDPIFQYKPTFITSPTAGIVAQMDITEGSQVNPGQKLALVTDPKLLKLTLEVPAQDLPFISKGHLGTFQSTQVRVLGISPFVDPTTGTATCELEFTTPPKGELAPGVIGQVSFKTNLRHGFTIPEAALVYRGNDTFVRLVKDGKAKELSVELGKKQSGRVEILKGLTENNILIERSSRFVKDGEPVRLEGDQVSPEGEAR